MKTVIKKIKIYFLLSIMFLSNVFAQTSPKNTYNLDGKINFMKLTEAGVLLIAHKDGFAGIKPESNKLIFDFKDYGSVKEEELEFVPDSPYVVIAQGGFANMSSKKTVFDYVIGKQLFETKENGWKDAFSTQVFLPQNKLVVAGVRTSKEKFAPAVGIYDLVTGKEDKLIYLIEPGKVTMGTVTITGSVFMKDKKIYIPTSKELICYDTNTSNKIWSAKVDDLTWLTSDESGKEIYGFEGTNGGDTKIYKISSSGEVLWKEAQKVKGAVTRFEILPQGIAVVSDVADKGGSVFAAKAESKITMLSAKDGADLWDKAPKTKGYVQHFYIMEDGILFGIQSGGINKISFTGETLFKKPLKTGENIHTMALTPKGMIYITDSDADIINLKTGESIWNKSIKYKSKSAVTSTYDSKNKRYLISTGDEIVAIDENSGTISTLTAYKFEEKESPTSFSVRNGGLLLSSDQNIMMLNFDGSKKFHEYYKSPGRSTFGKIMGGVLAVASTAASVSMAARAGANRTGYGGVNDMSSYNDYGKEAKRASDMFASIGSASFDYMSKRFKASAATENSQFILTKLDDGVGLVKINKDSGTKEKEIVLKDKKPQYEVDEYAGVLYYQKDDKTIEAFDLN
ncbi:outer membrane protein assembly factor BamB family protein [Flavobacterium capsici]|uniref:PQQ-binding-like beta-propeller repeat protein n=1 Tax=Flavobacterium capsici TaxID=3075618 RepID=A0AA96EXN5_9FLAO|nr:MULTISPECIES: PQQ-binding-like beta-propeller repeat protein [unclassified Flavobacterium]WNM19104.1 PQQ-binding-like beta-propeller repeat protein [Flavobacterium sp. PMR2A8]WNM20493.1 PQQ-binding-like beta-propeller repeat protein [Flavobacterium sp. PMTSA4]